MSSSIFPPDTPILILDKTSGESSAQALNRTKKLFPFSKAGHGGTLDPLASGLLPIFFDGATRFLQYILHASKSYTVLACLGVATTTYDSEGEHVQDLSSSQEPPQIEAIETLIKEFIGEIDQVPPIFSAKKINGQPAYKLARSRPTATSQEMGLASCRVTVSAITIVSYNYPSLELKITCSSGTYVRSLIHDLGQRLHIGAHVQGLRRTGISSVPNVMHSYSQLQAMNSEDRLQCLISVNDLQVKLEKIEVEDEDIIRLYQGLPINYDLKSNEDQEVFLINKQQSIFGIGVVANSFLRPRRLLPKQL